MIPAIDDACQHATISSVNIAFAMINLLPMLMSMFAPGIGWREGGRTCQPVERRDKRANWWQEGASGLTRGCFTR
eukprot:3216676-Karenia_brevis.AAC.1